MSNSRGMLAGVLLGVALATVGCATGGGASGGKVRIKGSTMCSAHGGTYSTATKSCTYTASTKSLREACQAQQGSWDDASEYCSIDPM
jgi:hypothetical protein